MANGARRRLAAAGFDERLTVLMRRRARATNPDLGSRSASQRIFGHLDNCPSSRFIWELTNNPPAIRPGTVRLSTTLIHGVHFIDPKWPTHDLLRSSSRSRSPVVLPSVCALRRRCDGRASAG
jgi:hypothetical protein